MARRRPTLMQRSRSVSPEAKAEGHQTGKGRLPKRAFFGVAKADETAIIQKIERFVAKSLRRS